MIIISAAVAILIHFPEVLSLSDHFEQQVLFEKLSPLALLNEITFTFLTLIFLFWINSVLFSFNNTSSRITGFKIAGSFILVWVLNAFFGQFFVYMHHVAHIAAIDAMLHHYLHPLRDFIMACVVTGSSYIIYLTNKQQRILIENQELRTESVTSQYEVLKNQLNPHMLFNSLNTLQSLIREDTTKASNYTLELSNVLRYTLQVNDFNYVTVSQELKFAKAYIYLIQMRYEDNIAFEINIDNAYLDSFLPPMALQMLIENAVKHNEISNRKPLQIHIYTNATALVVENKIQRKLNENPDGGIGLSNLAKRYKLLFQKEIIIQNTNGTFQVTIPLIKFI